MREGRETGRREERISSIRNMVELGVPKEKILIKYTLAEYERGNETIVNTGKRSGRKLRIFLYGSSPLAYRDNLPIHVIA